MQFFLLSNLNNHKTMANLKEELRMVDVNVRPKRSKRLDYKAMVANEDHT